MHSSTGVCDEGQDGDGAHNLVGVREFIADVLPHNRGKMLLPRDLRCIRKSGILPRFPHD